MAAFCAQLRVTNATTTATNGLAAVGKYEVVCESSGSLAALEGHVLSQPTCMLELRHIKEAIVIRSVPRSAGVRHRRVVMSKDANRRLVGIPPLSQARPKVSWYYGYYSNGEKMCRSEIRNDFCCPWCAVYAGDLSGLLCHVTCSHR